MHDDYRIELEVNMKIWSTMIDFRRKRGEIDWSVVRLGSDPSMVLYKDGVCRKTTQEEIIRQLAQMNA